ncbi:MAG: nucleotide exchange factor GrpE [Defluviitaleaceae bacterium]|nr:nucleotide exchange factor GrpE [Defluviitaleaceae bacterium]
MSLLSKFFKKTSDSSTNHELIKLASEVKSSKQEINQYLQQMTQMVQRVESKQKETILQLDELSDQISNNDDEYALAQALASTITIIEDFYRLTTDDPALDAQSQMMWNAAKKAAATAGLEIIDDSGKPADFKRHRIEGTATDTTVPYGHILQILKCGYLYKNTVLRTASVLVNKEEAE